MDTENRSILILFSVFVLLVFLDHQSASQLRRHAPAIDRIRPADLLQGDGRPDSGQESSESATGPAAPGDVDLDRPAIDAGDSAAVMPQPSDRVRPGEGTSQKARLVVEGAVQLAKKTVLEHADTHKLKLKEVSLGDVPPNRLPLLASTRTDGREITRVELFFPAFQGKRTVMMRVHRTVPGRVDPMVLLRLLQKGPSQKEKGLVNAFDESVPIESVELQGDLAIIHAGAGIHRMSGPILQDRLDQMRLTLAQFASIQSLRLMVDGRVVNRLGKGKDSTLVPERLRESLRAAEDYRDL